MTKCYSALVCVLALCICSNNSLFSQTIIYVDSSATGLNNGQSWQNAYKNLDSAFINAVDYAEEYSILVAKGTYTPSLIPGNLVTGNSRDVSFYINFSGVITGGYSPGGSALNSQLYPTILSGDIGIKNDSLDNAYHVLTLQYSDVEISGITIIGGNANGSGSLEMDYGNIPRNIGGGIYILNGFADLHEIIAEHNTAFYGGGLYNDSSQIYITNAVFTYNHANKGGAIYNNSSSESNITNVVAYRNSAQISGGAILNDNATDYIITNCTFVENYSLEFLGGAIYNTKNSSTSTLTNCLFSGNYWEDPYETNFSGSDIFDASNNVNANYCVFQTNFHPGKHNYLLTGSGVADIQNPKGPDNIWMTKDDGLSITVESPAFKNGGNETLYFDITGAERDVVDNGFDIGAYEINTCGQLTGRIVYVDSSATGTHNGTSWTNAFTDLQTAINLARLGCVDTIKVAGGTYHPSNYLLGTLPDKNYTPRFQLSSNMAILGGYPGGGSSIANPVTNKTILSNKNSQVVFAGDVQNVLLSGLYIEDGTVQGTGNFTVNDIDYPANEGGGILVYNSIIEIRDCYIRNNYAEIRGGGMAAVNSVVKMLRCSFEGNLAGNEGGGIYMSYLGTTSIFDSCAFTNNVANYYNGGAIFIGENTGNIIISNSRFKANKTLSNSGTAIGGGAVFSASQTLLTITKCVFDSNHSIYGGAVYLGGNSRTAIHKSFFLNNIAAVNGGAIEISGYEANIYNSVFSENKAAKKGGALNSAQKSKTYFSTFIRNEAGTEGGAVAGFAPFLFYNCITWLNSVAGDSTSATPDPMFANINDIAGPDSIYGTGDDGLKLTLQSPFINEGGELYDTSLIHSDITGAPRLQSIETDRGAYELDFCGLSAFVNKTIYVDSSAVAGNNMGRDWANAFTDLESALRAFRSGCNIDTIKVAKGTYFPTAMPGYPPFHTGSGFDNTFYLDENLVLIGGYPTGGGIRDIHQNPTILSAHGYSWVDHVVLIVNKTNVSIDGFNIVDGSPSRSTFNYYDNETIEEFGGGLYASNSKLNIKNTTFRNNDVSGAYIKNCTGTLTNCIWDSNTTYFAGGGVFNSGSSVEYDNCIFYKNVAEDAWGGGLYINNTISAIPSFNSCTFYGNISSWGGGMYSGGTPYITNCLFWGNSSNNNRPDSSANDIYAGVLDGRKISNSLFQYNLTTSPGINSIYGLNPDFADATNGPGPDNIWGTADDGLKPTGTSYAINNGLNDSISTNLFTDITGAPRINTGVIDIGAYEYDCGFTNITNRLVPVGISEIVANTFNTCGKWQYRTSVIDASKYIIEIDKNGNENFNPVQIKIDVTNTQSHIATNGNGDTTAIALRMVSINAPGEYPINGGLKIRIFYDPAELDTLPGVIHYWFKHTAQDKSTILSNLRADTLLNQVPIIPSGYGIIDGIHYVEFDSLNSFSTFGYVGVTRKGALPLNYLSFSAKWQETEKSVLLNWVTANEENVQTFVVERSTDARVWNSIGNLNADQISAMEHSYKWIDHNPLAGYSYYRIKEMDIDGRLTFSAVKMVKTGDQLSVFRILPNPVKNNAIIKLAGLSPVVNYKVANATGRTILSGQLKYQSEFSFSLANQSEGIYFITVNGITQKLILSK